MTGLPLVGDEFAGYRVPSVLGRGGMSVVYRAEDLRPSSLIAPKVLAPGLAAESIGTVFNTVWTYDLASSAWCVLPNLAAPRHGLAVAAIGNTLYTIDGASQPGHNASTPPYKPSPLTTREISRP